jgi:pyruvate dehydrogenase E1 component
MTNSAKTKIAKSTRPTKTGPDIAALDALDSRLRWLSSWTVHNANHLRESRDGLKVGGHQASCASITAIMTALYFHALGPNDKVAVKPHAGPVLHAIHYLLGNQTLAQLQAFRAMGGAQSYPSRTKDVIPVDFSTGSVGLGVAVTAFASLIQDYLIAHGGMAQADAGRMIALMGDAELDEGNIYECLIESYKHQVRNCWWIVDYNRQSLDSTTADRMFRRFDDIFETCGWRVVTIKSGRLQKAAFKETGGQALSDWIDDMPNAEYAALTYQGGSAWRERLLADIGTVRGIPELLAKRDDAALSALMTNLGGHCIHSICEAFDSAQDERPTLFIAYTVKGYGLPFAGHKDNHSGLMTPTQIEQLRTTMGIAAGDEWEPWAGLGDNIATTAKALAQKSPLARQKRARAPIIAVPPIAAPEGQMQSTQAAFGKILLELAKNKSPLADRIVTTSPDVTVSTNLGAWVNQRGLFRRQELPDVFRNAKIPSAQKWGSSSAGQHVELGIAENNLFLMLAAMGLAGDIFGERLIPIGTVYDPFISRGLDALNYACYQDARFLLVATPSGVTLGPEGGAHQSINPPLIAMGQPGLRHYEPAFADELALFMHEAFNLMQAPDGESVYLRLTTRELYQPVREQAWQADAVAGAYWLKQPGAQCEGAIVAMGAVMPEAIEAWEAMNDEMPGLGLLSITSPDLLHRDWSANGKASHIASLLGAVPRNMRMVTLTDGSPGALSWIGAVHGQRVVPLGTDRFGQTGDLPDLYKSYGLDADAIISAMAKALA